MNQVRIGKFIAELRKQKNLTQKEFAEKLNVTDKTVSRWENGHYLPDISLFHDICSILDIDVSELLNGKKIEENLNKKEVNKITMNLVKISNEKMKQNKKKIITLSSIITIIIVVITIFILKTDKQPNYHIKPNTEVHYPLKMAYIEKEDGWVCSFKIEYLQHSKVPNNYHYDCDNFKYKELYDFAATGTEADEGGTFTYIASTNHPSYSYNQKYKNDLVVISTYFEQKRFTDTITSKDLDNLSLTYIDKEEILNLYNQAITSKMIPKYGTYPNIGEDYLTTSLSKNGYIWYLGFLTARGNIQYVYLDVRINNEYLSDIIKEQTATQEQLELYRHIQTIKEHIIKTQSFTLPSNLSTKHPYTFLKENFDKINNVELGKEHY